MSHIVGFLSSLNEMKSQHLLGQFQSQLAIEAAPRRCNRSGHDVPNDLSSNEVFICTRFADGNYNQLRGANGLAQQLLDAGSEMNIRAVADAAEH